MVSQKYLETTETVGPSASKRFVDQQVIPTAIDVLGTLEVALQQTAESVGVRPSILVASSTACVGTLTGWALLRLIVKSGQS